MGYSAIAIANFFIDKSLKTGIQLTDMMLQKMVFFAHAVYMKTRHEPLIDDAIIAMQHGPVIMSLYRMLKKYGRNPVTQQIVVAVPSDDEWFDWQSAIPSVQANDTERRAFLENAWGRLSKMTARELRKASHAKGGAWYRTVESQGLNPGNEDDVKRIPRNLTILDNIIQECGR